MPPPERYSGRFSGKDLTDGDRDPKLNRSPANRGCQIQQVLGALCSRGTSAPTLNRSTSVPAVTEVHWRPLVTGR